MKINSIAIIGLGLMGASLAAACRKKFPHAKVIGISRSPEALRLASRKKWIHESSYDLSALKSKAPDLVVLATPVSTFQTILKKIENQFTGPVLVTDVGSTKGEIEAFIERSKFKKVSFIGAHPMCGSHERGALAARGDLYDHGLTFVAKPVRGREKSFSRVRDFWKKISPCVVPINAQVHDNIVAEISHLPHAVASILVRSVSAKALQFAASGFKDTTRVAQGHPSLWAPIFLSNTKAVLRSIKNFEQELSLFRHALERKNERFLLSFLTSSSRKRSQISL